MKSEHESDEGHQLFFFCWYSGDPLHKKKDILELLLYIGYLSAILGCVFLYNEEAGGSSLDRCIPATLLQKQGIHLSLGAGERKAARCGAHYSILSCVDRSGKILAPSSYLYMFLWHDRSMSHNMSQK